MASLVAPAPHDVSPPFLTGDKLTVEAKVLADLKIEKAAVDGERRKVEADLGPVQYLATLIGQPDEVVLRLGYHVRA